MTIDIRTPKSGRPHAKKRLRKSINGHAQTRRKVEVSIFMDDELLAQCNEAWLQSPHRYFSRWVCEKLREATSK